MQLYRGVERKLIDWGVPADSSGLATSLAIAVAVVVIAVIAKVVAKRFIVRGVEIVVRRTEATWDDRLLAQGVFDQLSHLAPALLLFGVLPLAFPDLPDVRATIRGASLAYMTIVVAYTVDNVLSAAVEILQGIEMASQRPWKSYAQVLKIVSYLLTGILLVSIALGQSPLALLGGLGALSAVLMLVFKDPLLGLVASIQLSANDMVRRGDPIEVPKHGIEGDVLDISLTTVKVLNADKTIATIPNYALVSDAFRNLRGIREAGVRRIKRALQIDVQSVRFLAPRAIERLALNREVDERLPDLATQLAGAPQTTNLGVFRAYVEAFRAQRTEARARHAGARPPDSSERARRRRRAHLLRARAGLRRLRGTPGPHVRAPDRDGARLRTAPVPKPDERPRAGGGRAPGSRRTRAASRMKHHEPRVV